MNRLSRAVAALCAAGLAVPLWAVPAQAQAAPITETASSAAYFFSGGSFQPDPAPAAPPNLLSDRGLDFVAPGNLGVAAVAGQEDKVSFVFFSLTDLPLEATITKATLTMKLAPESNENRRINPGPQQVRACSPDDSGFGGQDGENLSQKAPARKCDVFAANALESSTPDQYVFDITGLAANWATANDGVALTKRAESAPNFQVVFTPDAVLTYEFVAPPEDLGTSVDDLGTSTGDVSTDLGTGFTDPGTTTGSFDTGSFSGGTTSTDSFGGGGFDSAVAAPLTGAALPSSPAPETAVDTPAVAAQTRAAPVAATVSSSPTAGFWIAGLLLAGALAFLSLVMGDPRAGASAATARPSRLSQALSSARRGGTTPLLGARGA